MSYVYLVTNVFSNLYAYTYSSGKEKHFNKWIVLPFHSENHGINDL